MLDAGEIAEGFGKPLGMLWSFVGAMPSPMGFKCPSAK